MMKSFSCSSITIQSSAEVAPALLPWFGEVVLIVTYLRKLGLLGKISEQVRFARRRFGQYEVLDFVAVLIGYAISGEGSCDFLKHGAPPAHHVSKSRMSRYL